MTLEELMKIIEAADIMENPRQLNPAVPLRDQGVDSLDVVSILIAVERATKLKIIDDPKKKALSLNDILAVSKKV